MKKVIFVCLFSAIGLMAADGAALYKRCIACHGANGEKIPPGSKATTAVNVLTKEKIVEDLKGYKAKTLNQYGAGPLMSAQAASLSDDDIVALADYIVTLKK